jgi:hypothetical protein
MTNVSAAKRFDLHEAVVKKDIAQIGRLLQRGADINQLGPRRHGYGSALHIAVREGHLDIAKLLIDRGAEIDVLDRKDFTPLHNATWNGNLEMTKLLLDAGANIEASTYDGDTPLTLAQNNDQAQVAAFIQAKLQPSATSEVKVESVATNDTGVIDISGTYTNTELTYPSAIPRPLHSRLFFGDGSNLKVTIKQSGNAITGVISGEYPGEFKGVIKGREITIELSMNSLESMLILGKGTWLVSNDGDALTGNYRLYARSIGNTWGSWNYGDVVGNWNFRKIE